MIKEFTAAEPLNDTLARFERLKASNPKIEAAHKRYLEEKDLEHSLSTEVNAIPTKTNSKKIDNKKSRRLGQ